MNDLFRGIRPLDYVLAGVLTAMGAVWMLMNITTDSPGDPELAHAITSQSWLMLPVFLVATGAILWRRRSMAAVIVVSAVAMGAHVLAFDWVIRCGVGLPLTFALAYGVGRLSSQRTLVPELIGVLGVQYLVLVRDSAAGLDIFPFTAVATAVVFAIGAAVQSEVAKRADRAATPEPTFV